MFDWDAQKEKEKLRFLFSFKGRISRREYWLRGILPGLGMAIAVGLIAWLFDHYRSFSAGNVMHNLAVGQMSWVFIAVQVKRLQDFGSSGWWLLTIFIPIVGWVYFAITIAACALSEGEPGENDYGSPPIEASLREGGE